MKQIRSILIAATVSLTLLGGATAAASAEAPFPFGSECVSHIATMHEGGVGPHIMGMHDDISVGRHLQDMRTGDHECMHHMENGAS